MATAIAHPCEECLEKHKRERAATWIITGMGPGCSDGSCCGWDEYACDEHKEQALTAMPESWGLQAQRLAKK